MLDGLLGSSRRSYADVRDELTALAGDLEPGALQRAGDELVGVAGVFHEQGALRRAASDPGYGVARRTALADDVFAGRLSEPVVRLVRTVVGSRWSRGRDLVDVLDALGAQAQLLAAEKSGTLDGVEDELFRFGRVLVSNPQLHLALSTPLPGDRKTALLHTLLVGKADETTVRLLTSAAAQPHGRTFGASLDGFVRIAAALRGRSIAEVRAAVPPTAEQVSRLETALARIYERSIHVQIVVDPAVIGGLTIRIGDEVIDGSVAARLEQARNGLVA